MSEEKTTEVTDEQLAELASAVPDAGVAASAAEPELDETEAEVNAEEDGEPSGDDGDGEDGDGEEEQGDDGAVTDLGELAETKVKLKNGQVHSVAALAETFEYHNKRVQELAEERKAKDAEAKQWESKYSGIVEELKTDPFGSILQIASSVDAGLAQAIKSYFADRGYYDDAKANVIQIQREREKLEREKREIEQAKQGDQRTELINAVRSHMERETGKPVDESVLRECIALGNAIYQADQTVKDPVMVAYNRLYGRDAAKRARAKPGKVQRPGASKPSKQEPSDLELLEAAMAG